MPFGYEMPPPDQGPKFSRMRCASPESSLQYLAFCSSELSRPAVWSVLWSGTPKLEPTAILGLRLPSSELPPFTSEGPEVSLYRDPLISQVGFQKPPSYFWLLLVTSDSCHIEFQPQSSLIGWGGVTQLSIKVSSDQSQSCCSSFTNWKDTFSPF